MLDIFKILCDGQLVYDKEAYSSENLGSPLTEDAKYGPDSDANEGSKPTTLNLEEVSMEEAILEDG